MIVVLLEPLLCPPADDADDAPEPPPPDHLTWIRLGHSPPKDADGEETGEELTNPALSAALATRTRFTEAEWKAFNVTSLSTNHYIKAGDAYFRPADPLLKQLADFAMLTLMSLVGNALVCSDTLGDSTCEACLNGKCQCCGFARLWSKGIRPTLFKQNDDGTEELCHDVDPIWERKITYDSLKPGGDDNYGSSEDALRHSVTAKITDFLDAFEIVQRNWVPHRYHTVQAKVAERELDQNLTPRKLKSDSDWSENGEIVVKEQLQSEYWHIRYYSLLITITCFLVTADWVDRQSALPTKAEVTVQPEWAVPSDGQPWLTYTKGSAFAFVETGSDAVGENVEYTVVLADGSRKVVARSLLRRRIWHRIAFLGVTNEKRHVSTSTQAFHSRQLRFWQAWNDRGRTAALAEDLATDRAAAPNDAPSATPAAANAPACDNAADTDVVLPDVIAEVAPAAFAIDTPEFANFLVHLEEEAFWAYITHNDNATHFKSSGILNWWSHQQDEVVFIHSIWCEYGCPGKGKGPWDGLGAMAKTKVRNDITNNKCRSRSGRIRNAREVLATVLHHSPSLGAPQGAVSWCCSPVPSPPLSSRLATLHLPSPPFSSSQVAQHLRATFSTGKWLKKHAHMKIHEIVVMYIDQDEIVWPDPEPKYETLKGISSAYCFMMRGGGRVAMRRLCCWCPACSLAHETGEGMDATLKIAGCARGHLSCFEEHTIGSSIPADRGAAKRRAQELWAKLKKILAAGKVVCVQARELWSEEERIHLRPGHFWLALLGDADGEGSPILAGPFKERTFWPPEKGESGWKDKYQGISRQRYDPGECALLLRHYYHRTVDDPEQLTFVGWQAKEGEKLVVNSSEVSWGSGPHSSL